MGEHMNRVMLLALGHPQPERAAAACIGGAPSDGTVCAIVPWLESTKVRARRMAPGACLDPARRTPA